MRFTRILLASFLFCSLLTLPLHTEPNHPADLVAEGWNAWERGDQTTVEQKFLAAIAEDPNNIRAHLGLSFLYSLQRKYEQAWKSYQKVVAHGADREAYLFAAWSTPKFYANLTSEDLDLLTMVEQIAERGDSTGTLQAMANELLANYARYRDEDREAKRRATAMHCVIDWKVIGPFDNISASGHDKIYPPEEEFNADARYSGKNGVPATWFKPAAVRPDNWIDFTRYFSTYNAVFYANTFIYSPAQQKAHLRIGTSGSFKAFLNDEMVDGTIDEYNNDLDTYISEVTLQQGWNRVVLKCGYSDIERCNFMLRVTDARGQAIEGMKVSVDAQQYTSRPGAKAARVTNFAEEFFRAQIARNPSHIENYLLLADCYLRNDKSVEAELALRDALKLAPNSPLVYDRLIEAYNRGDKSDEITKALDKIYAVDKNVPSAIEYKFSQYLKTEEYDKAEELLQQFESLSPGSADLYDMKFQYYGSKEMVEKIIETCKEAYEKYPQNSRFVMAAAVLQMQVSRSPGSVIKIYKDYLDEELDETIMAAMASAYLEMSDIASWRKTYERIIALNPASPGYPYQMANTYFSAGDYASAEEMLKRSIEICPNSSVLWAKLGEVQRIQGKNAAATDSYAKALEYDPTDYSSRSILRELRGKKSVFEQFGTVNIDSVLRHAHAMDVDYDDGAVIVFENAQHVIYERGASESAQELVVRVLNPRGIDDWKEYVIPYNSYNEELIIDKAAVVKKDGSETKADISDNYVVFKSLEENDVIRLKWHTKNHYSGKLSNHFFDTYYFNGYYPARHVRYEVLAPKDFEFDYKTQNMKVEPARTQVEDGTLYRWTLDSLPAISYEYGMPTIGDIGSVLYISSIDSWEYMVSWYADIASAKTRSSYEIKEQVADLLKGKESASDEEKVQAIYNFITENIRYSSVAFRQGSHIPQKARDVLVNKIGDCKDVATLCIAMLREAGMTGHYVLVNTRDEGLNRNTLPSSLAFNHCIVAVETRNGERYLDLTANNYPIGSTPEGDLDAFALVIKPGVKGPIYLPREGSIPRTLKVSASAEVRADNSMTSRRSTTGTGSVAAGFRSAFRDQARKEQEKMVVAHLSSSFQNVKLTSLDMQNLNTLAPHIKFDYEFEVPNYVSDAGEFKLFKIPWSYQASTDPALSYEEREYPYVYWPTEDTLVEDIEIRIPDGFAPVDLPPTVKYSSRIADYSLKYNFVAGKLQAQRTFITKKPVVDPEEYQEFKGFHNNVLKEDTRQILLKKKGKK